MENRTSLLSLYMNNRRQQPLPQSDHPPAIRQNIHKYQLPYGTTEQLISVRLCCETPELVLDIPLTKIGVAGLKDTINTLFMKHFVHCVTQSPD